MMSRHVTGENTAPIEALSGPHRTSHQFTDYLSLLTMSFAGGGYDSRLHYSFSSLQSIADAFRPEQTRRLVVGRPVFFLVFYAQSWNNVRSYARPDRFSLWGFVSFIIDPGPSPHKMIDRNSELNLGL